MATAQQRRESINQISARYSGRTHRKLMQMFVPQDDASDDDIILLFQTLYLYLGYFTHSKKLKALVEAEKNKFYLEINDESAYQIARGVTRCAEAVNRNIVPKKSAMLEQVKNPVFSHLFKSNPKTYRAITNHYLKMSPTPGGFFNRAHRAFMHIAGLFRGHKKLLRALETVDNSALNIQDNPDIMLHAVYVYTRYCTKSTRALKIIKRLLKAKYGVRDFNPKTLEAMRTRLDETMDVETFKIQLKVCLNWCANIQGKELSVARVGPMWTDLNKLINPSQPTQGSYQSFARI